MLSDQDMQLITMGIKLLVELSGLIALAWTAYQEYRMRKMTRLTNQTPLADPPR